MNKKTKILLAALIVLSLMTMAVSAGNIGEAITNTVKTLVEYVARITITSPTDDTRFGRTNVQITYGVENSAADVKYDLNGELVGSTEGSPFTVTGVDDGTDGGKLNTVRVHVVDPVNGSAEDTVTFKVDTTAPGEVTGIDYTRGINYINWTWNPPTNSDFNNVIVKVTQGATVIVPDTVIPKGTNYYNATGLDPDTEYTISVRTEDDAPAP